MDYLTSQLNHGVAGPVIFKEEEKDDTPQGIGGPKPRKHVTSACFACKNGKVKVC